MRAADAAPLCGRDRRIVAEATVPVSCRFCGEPIARSPRHDSSTQRRRSHPEPRHAGGRVHRPPVPQPLPAAAADPGRGRLVLPRRARQPRALLCPDGSH